MPIWLYEVRPLYTALVLIVFIETVSIICLMLVRRFVIPRLRYHESVNDAVSGTVQAGFGLKSTVSCKHRAFAGSAVVAIALSIPTTTHSLWVAGFR